jgi:hypothetical protein
MVITGVFMSLVGLLGSVILNPNLIPKTTFLDLYNTNHLLIPTIPDPNDPSYHQKKLELDRYFQTIKKLYI